MVEVGILGGAEAMKAIGLGLFCMLRDYASPEKMNAFFGLDNSETPLIWQRFIARAVLAAERADPSIAATYVPTVPGKFIMVEEHLDPNGFSVDSK